MTSELQSGQTHRKTWRRRAGRVALMGLLLLASVEVAFRLFMAIQLGPRALLYGTPLFRQEISVARQKHTEWRRGVARSETDDPAQSPSRHADVRAGYSKYFPHEAKIDVDDAGNRFTYRLNGQGMRGADFAPQKAPGTLRVITLGASSTYGFGARDDETYPSLLQQQLNERCTASRKYEVINFGIPHLTSAMIRELFVAEGLPLAPDVVVFYEGINDASAAPGGMSIENIRDASRSSPMMSQVYGALIRVYRAIRDRSMALLLIDNLLQVPSRSTRDQVTAYLSEDRVTRFLANVRAIRDAAEKSGAVFIAASQQAKSFLVPRETIRGVTYAEERRRIQAKLADEGVATEQELFFLAHAALMDALRNWARTDNVPFVDAIERLDGRRDLLYTYVHPNAQGNALLADAIADGILLRTCK